MSTRAPGDKSGAAERAGRRPPGRDVVETLLGTQAHAILRPAGGCTTRSGRPPDRTRRPPDGVSLSEADPGHGRPRAVPALSRLDPAQRGRGGRIASLGQVGPVGGRQAGDRRGQRAALALGGRVSQGTRRSCSAGGRASAPNARCEVRRATLLAGPRETVARRHVSLGLAPRAMPPAAGQRPSMAAPRSRRSPSKRAGRPGPNRATCWPAASGSLRTWNCRCCWVARSDAAVAVDSHQESTVRGTYCAGELTGIGGAELAVVEGLIAGLSATGRKQEAAAHFAARARGDALRQGPRPGLRPPRRIAEPARQ